MHGLACLMFKRNTCLVCIHLKFTDKSLRIVPVGRKACRRVDFSLLCFYSIKGHLFITAEGEIVGEARVVGWYILRAGDWVC